MRSFVMSCKQEKSNRFFAIKNRCYTKKGKLIRVKSLVGWDFFLLEK